jgi:hypothetical protein
MFYPDPLILSPSGVSLLCPLYHCQNFYCTCLYIWVAPEFSLMGSVLHLFFAFCVVLFCFFTFWVPYCEVRYDFRIETMFGLSLPPVVRMRVHGLFTLFVFACIKWCPKHMLLSICVFRRLVYPMLPVSLDCPFWLSLSVFSNIYLSSDHPFVIRNLLFVSRTSPTWCLYYNHPLVAPLIAPSKQITAILPQVTDILHTPIDNRPPFSCNWQITAMLSQVTESIQTPCRQPVSSNWQSTHTPCNQPSASIM